MKILNPYINNIQNLKIGDFILFQEYYSPENNKHKVSKPIFAIYLGFSMADMAASFDYVKVPKEDGLWREKTIESFFEWSNWCDVLGIWHQKPNWKEILEAYRKYEPLEEVDGFILPELN